MGRIIAWLILIFVVLLALRVMALRKARGQRHAARAAGSMSAAKPMVRCARCGVFLPRTEATPMGGDYVCASGDCVPHG